MGSADFLHTTGTVTLHDSDGEALCTIRQGTMPEGDRDGLVLTLANAVYHLLQRAPHLRLSLLADGAPDIWDMLNDQINRQRKAERVARVA